MQGIQNGQNNLGEKKKKNSLPDFKNLLQNYSNQGSMAVAKGKHTAKWHGAEGSEIHSYICSQVIFNKDPKTIQWLEGWGG